MKWLGIIAAFVTLTASAPANAQDSGLTLKMGRLDYDRHGFFSQKIELKNDRSATVELVEVRCGAFANNELIAVPVAVLIDIPPGHSGYGAIKGRTDVKPDRFDCRIGAPR